MMSPQDAIRKWWHKTVGGWLLEIQPMKVPTDNGKRREVVRLWMVDRQGDETCIYAEPADLLPKVGDQVWWQDGKIYFDGDHKIEFLIKVGDSFSP